MKKQEVYDNSGFKFTGTDGKTYGYNKDGQPTQIGLQNSVPYNPPTLLSGNNNSNTATFQPQPTLNTGSLGTDRFGTIGSSGYTGVAESHAFNNPYGGIHAMGGGIHGKYVEPLPQQIQPVQTVINTTQPVVKQEVVITKPVLTQKEIQAEADAWAKPFIEAKKSNIKAKAIVEKLVVDQEEGGKVLDLSNTRLSKVDMNELMEEVAYVNFDLDILSLENTQFDHIGAGSSALNSFMRIFTVLNKGVFHNVVYLNLANTYNNYYNGDGLVHAISRALVKGDMKSTKVINLTSNNITDKGAYEIADAMKTGNFKLEQFNLSGNKITDEGLISIGEALETGKVNNLKYLDISGNEGITEKGEGYLIKAVEKTPNDSLNITFVSTSKHFTKQDSIGKHAIKYALKTFLTHAKENGVDVDYVTTNKETVDYLYDVGKTSGRLLLGYGKCAYKVVELISLDFNAASLAVDGVIEYSGNKVAKKLNFWACLGMESYDAILTPEGADLAVKGLELIGDNE